MDHVLLTGEASLGSSREQVETSIKPDDPALA
jgi:hypothetical protein